MPKWFRKATVGAQVPTVRLINDYGVRWPLWGDMENYPYEVGAPQVSEELTAAILAWAANFNEYYDHEHGWPDAAKMEAHFDEGHRLAADLQGEFGERYQVRLALWETNCRN